MQTVVMSPCLRPIDTHELRGAGDQATLKAEGDSYTIMLKRGGSWKIDSPPGPEGAVESGLTP
jgi:hypothetical protein